VELSRRARARMRVCVSDCRGLICCGKEKDLANAGSRQRPASYKYIRETNICPSARDNSRSISGSQRGAVMERRAGSRKLFRDAIRKAVVNRGHSVDDKVAIKSAMIGADLI